MSTTTPARRRDAEANREAILEAAERIISGDPAASIDLIARGAGLTRRAVYGHFADRTALVHEVIARCAERIAGIAVRNRAESLASDPILAIADLADALWREADRIRVVAALARDGEHGDAVNEALRPLRERLLEVCRTGRDQNVVRADLPAVQTARLLEEVARGAILGTDDSDPQHFPTASLAVLGAAGCGWREADAALTRRAALRQERQAAA
ncbi:TetR family transcriptional regulator [Leucobacter sp. CSA2]|uniref:TetR family transcriptional regulator n=1 Tax=Leucobacter edaphi TaxID=2796472 RepID=A0A934QDJ9_9MICO|nr:TetR family transcriptional regulator [Leucobacter edaphi]MBK0421846.1 TetR family transcriptional regulator [Leucobacter edaphi]